MPLSVSCLPEPKPRFCQHLLSFDQSCCGGACQIHKLSASILEGIEQLSDAGATQCILSKNCLDHQDCVCLTPSELDTKEYVNLLDHSPGQLLWSLHLGTKAKKTSDLHIPRHFDSDRVRTSAKSMSCIDRLVPINSLSQVWPG